MIIEQKFVLISLENLHRTLIDSFEEGFHRGKNRDKCLSEEASTYIERRSSKEFVNEKLSRIEGENLLSVLSIKTSFGTRTNDKELD